MASIETFPDGRVPAIVPWYRQMWPWLMMLMPAIALVMVILFQLPPLSAKVAIIAAALPSGVNSYLIANKFGES